VLLFCSSVCLTRTLTLAHIAGMRNEALEQQLLQLNEEIAELTEEIQEKTMSLLAAVKAGQVLDGGTQGVSRPP
jgi:TolA-binding protein